MIATRLGRSTAILLSAITATLVGCGGSGGGSSRSSTTAPVGSGATSTTGSSVAASAAPNPGGQIAPLATSSVAVTATVSLGAHVAFAEQVSISDLVVPDVQGLRDRAFIVEDKNATVRVLDLSGATPRIDRAIPLRTTALPAGAATGALTIQDASTALVTQSGTNAEAVYLFNPSTARTAADVTSLSLTGLTVRWPAGTKNSKGADVGGSARPINYTAAAALFGSRLFVASSNLDASFDNEPGTVAVLTLDAQRRAFTGGQIIQTSRFNPTALTRVTTRAGDLLLVTNTGPFGAGPSSIDVIEPLSVRVVGTIQLGARNAGGNVVVSPDGRRGYVASAGSGEVYVLDLDGLDREVGNQTPRDLSARYLGGYALPGAGPTAFVSSIALSHTGNYLYAIEFNSSSVYVIDLANPSLARRVTGFARRGNVANYEGLVNKLAVRPGAPGRDFQGPSILAMTINLAAADQTVRNVKVALDTISVDKQ